MQLAPVGSVQRMVYLSVKSTVIHSLASIQYEHKLLLIDLVAAELVA